MLGLKIVPVTNLVYLSSPSINYKKKVRKQCVMENMQMPLKLGSLQLFADGCEEAKKFFNARILPQEQLLVNICFLLEFQKMVILDYAIRNTDRGMDNWLITKQLDSPATTIKIIAIDHGLAFPFRHPSQFRSYPYSWSKMPFARKPFMEEIQELYLKNVCDVKFWDEVERELEIIFRTDRKFKEEIFQEQMELMRGQLANLADAIEKRESPFDLTQKQLIIIKKERIIEILCSNCIQSQINLQKSQEIEKKSKDNVLKYKCTCQVKIKLKKVPISQQALFSCW